MIDPLGRVSAAHQRILDAQQACREDNTPYEYNKCGLFRVCCIECAWGIYTTPSTVECLLFLTSGEWLRRTTVCFCQAGPSRDRQDPPNPGYPPFESFAMSLEGSDDLNIPDATPIDPVLEAGALPKFDMHLYKSSLNESHVRYLVKLYGIPEELHPRVAPMGMTMNALPLGAIGLYAYHFQQGGLRVPFSSFFLKILLLPCLSFALFISYANKATDSRFRTGLERIRHHDSSVADPFPRPNEYNAPDVAKLRDVVISLSQPPLSILYVAVITMAEFLRLPNFKCCKVAAGTLLPAGTARVTHLAPPVERLEDIPSKTGDMMVAEIPCRKVLDDKEKKKRKAKEKITTQALAAPTDSEHVSSPTPLNQAKPLEALANKEHVSLPLSVGRMDTLRDQTDEHVAPPGRRLDILEEPAPENVVSDAEASYFARRFGNLPFTPQWGLTDSSRMDNSRECRDMMANLFTPADEEFLTRALKEQHADLAYAHESCKDVKIRYKECKKEFAADRLEELEEEKKKADQLNSTQADRIKQLEEALKQSEADAHQLRVEKERYAVEAGRGKMATPNVDHASSDTFMDAYEKLFDRRYPYVDKVARMYLLDPSGLQNIMPNETGPTPGEGPRDTPTTSYV
ncbi:hypothetical protein Tco_0804258 [Tanacetum coccineum]|uniref:Uncharacterized protein n=1 Tax=Tanacetum coccineum TaxID=301880 RepID=A0ABQ5A3T7_9ASTR